jgi:hypothetical protein
MMVDVLKERGALCRRDRVEGDWRLQSAVWRGPLCRRPGSFRVRHSRRYGG